MSTPQDCLVCLQPIKRLWTPPTVCPCKPFIHERCWNSWTRHMGAQVCVICRGIPERRPRPVAAIMIIQREEPAPRHLPLYHRVLIVYAPWITMGFIILTLIWLQVQSRRIYFRPLTVGKPPGPPLPLPLSTMPPYLINNHDEL